MTQDTARFQEEFINILKEMTVSLKGRTEQGNEYSLFAIKRGKQWTYLIMDNSGYYSVKQDKEKSDEMHENSQSYTDMLCLMAKAKLLKKIDKPKNVSGLTFTCYYKYKPQAKKMYKSFNRIQGKAKYLNKNLKEGGSGIMKIIKGSMK
jgi:hypothetical protein